MKRKAHSELETLLEFRVKKILNAAERKPDEVSSIEEGMDSVCGVCQDNIKLCTSIPNYLCDKPHKSGTMLEENEMIALSIRSGVAGFCELCGMEIDKKFLRSNPTTLICSSCTAGVVRGSSTKSTTRTKGSKTKK